MKKNILLLLLIFTVNIFAVDKSVFGEIPKDDSVKTYNPLMTTALSLVPGGGQFATKHFTKGLLFLASEGIIGWIAVQQWKDYHDSFDKIFRWQDSLSNHDNSLDPSKDLANSSDSAAFFLKRMTYRNNIALAEYDTKLIRARYWNASALFGAVGIWNLLDAIGVSGRVSGNPTPNPRKAMALSAIPFSGAGQFYNGEWFKAGLTIATQAAFVFGGVQFQYMVNQSQRYVERLGAENNPETLNIDAWKDRYRTASQRRTMFFWYSIIFYIYGMTDAYVDASLHDFNKNFDITAGFNPSDNSAALGFSWKF